MRFLKLLPLCGLFGTVNALLNLGTLETPAPALAGPGAPPANASVAQIQQACSILQQKIGCDKVKLKTDLGVQYLKSVERSWNNQQTFYRPGCIVFPSTADDVQAAYKVIISGSVPYGVRSGSHGVAFGWCSTPGVLLDLANMDEVQYDASRGVAKVGPGNRWDHVYDTLAQQGQTVLGGRVSDVGMGLLLNGGVSYLSAEHGFASTNIVEVDIVLPNGQLVTASRTDHYQDLLWALQTGANSFGIITSFTLKTIALTGDFWGGLIFYAKDHFQDASDAAIDFFNNVTDPKAVIIPTFEFVGPPIGSLLQPFAIFAISYAAPQPPAGMFDRLTAIPSQLSTLKARPYAGPDGIVHLFDGFGSVYGNDQTFRTQAHRLTRDIGRAALAASFKLAETLGNDLATYSLSYEYLPPQAVNISNQQGGTPYGFDETPLTHILYNIAYKGTLPTSRKQRLLQTFNNIVDSVPASGKFPLYLPYASVDQRPLQTLRNYDRLKAIKTKYDPSGFIQAHAGGPFYS